MLEQNHQRRFSAAQCLEHDYFKKLSDSEDSNLTSNYENPSIHEYFMDVNLLIKNKAEIRSEPSTSKTSNLLGSRSSAGQGSYREFYGCLYNKENRIHQVSSVVPSLNRNAAQETNGTI